LKNTDDEKTADLIKRMEMLAADHEPDGWPAVQMKDIAALCEEIKRLKGRFYQFPRTRFVDENSIVYQLDHTQEEVAEAHRELLNLPYISALALEIMDIHHSTETALRILDEYHGVNIHKLRQAVIEKNKKRGYYA